MNDRRFVAKEIGMGRPKIEQKQKRIFRNVVRLTEEEQLQLDFAAQNCGLSTFRLIREKLLSGHFPEARIAKVDLGTYLELKKIGVNVNQLAKHANSGKFPFGIQKMLTRLMEQQELIIKILLHDSDPENR